MVARTLEVWLEQFKEPVGQLASTSGGDTSFSYTEGYLGRPDKLPVSLALPLKGGQFNDLETRAFFDNLLPENDQLNQVMERYGLMRTDIVGLLSHLGADCPGAISCIPPGQGPIKVPGILSTDYDLLEDTDVNEIVQRLADREPLPNEVRDPSPLAGVQRKIALTSLDIGRFGIPKPGTRVPTTHILKVPRRNKGREAFLEAAAAQLALTIGLEAAIPEVLEFEGLSALLVPRFDRYVDADGTVRRAHQEDFAQALGLPAALKYERYGDGNRRFDAGSIHKLLDFTSEPAKSKRDFLLITVFNLLVGNTDNHAKNHALLYDVGTSPRLSPLYDIIPVKLDSSVIHDLAFKIGSAERFNDMSHADLFVFFELFGLSKAAANRFVNDNIAQMITTIDQATGAFAAQGLKDFDDLIGQECLWLIELLKIDLSIRQRDHFVSRGGGWSLGS
jgi:serine/threonine-protein kinase HipA